MKTRAGFERWIVAGFASLTVAAIAAPVAAHGRPWMGAIVVLVGLAVVPWTARVLPPSLDGVFRRHHVRSVLWVLLASLAVLQMGRLSAFMADSRREWGATVPEPLSTHHQCLSAYVWAAELDRRGVPNLYDAKWYPMFDPPGPACRLVDSKVRGLASWVSDPYEYPPPFLLLPRAALALTGSFETIRAWWFVLRALALFGAAVGLAVWIGGREGLVLGLLIPAVLASLESMFDLQFGQFHAMAVLLAVAAVTAFHTRRDTIGGALLAAAILSKLFPAVLLPVLALRREWRALAWTAVFGAAFALLGLVVLGPAPYRAFVAYQIPRIASGAAFDFTHQGAHEVFLVSRDFSLHAISRKLGLLGVGGVGLELGRVAPWIGWLVLLVLMIHLGRGPWSRVGRVITSLALLNLAALQGPMAPSAYVLAPVLWMVALLATRVRGRMTDAIALGLAWVVVAGPPPLPDRVDLVLGLVCQAFVIALTVGVMSPAPCAWGPARAATVAAPFAPPPTGSGSVAAPIRPPA